MGAGPSLAKFLRIMEDEELTSMVEDVYDLDPQRIERVFAMAKLRYLEKARLKNGGDGAGDSEAAASSASAFAAVAASSAVASVEFPPMTGAGSALPTGMEDHIGPHAAHSNNAGAATMEDPAMNDSKDPMNALWSFEGHTLRELQPSDKNPQHSHNHSSHVVQRLHPSSPSEGDDAASPVKELDEDGHPILYGSCGRDKRYARCSVCYFRGLRCNSAHYCACCQRPVCIRPRKYPGEENPKICWNVLHMDKDMVHRVEKKKRRRLQQAMSTNSSATAAGAMGGGANVMKPDASSGGDGGTVAVRASPGAPRGSLTPSTTPPPEAGVKETIDL